MLLLLVLVLTLTTGAYCEVPSRGRIKDQYSEDSKIGLQYSSVVKNEEGAFLSSLFDMFDKPLSGAEGEECSQSGQSVTCQGQNVTTVPQNFDKNITIMKFIGTGVQTLSDGIFDIYNNLTWIRFEDNMLSEISKGAFRGLSDLVILTFKKCGLVDAIFEKETFQGLSSLKWLIIDQSNLTRLPRNLLANLTNLQTLNLDNNDIRVIEPDLLSSLPFLRTLRLENNKLTLIGSSAFQQMPNLYGLYLSKNNLNMSTSAFVNLHQLGVLSLANCNLTYLDGDAFMNKTSLKTLDIAGNNFICDCHASWMVEATTQSKPWTKDWGKTYNKKVYCGSPKSMSDILVTDLYHADLTCDKPDIESRTPTEVNHKLKTDLVLEALMIRGFPYSRWVFPDGSTIRGTKDVQQQTKKWDRHATESIRNSDHSVIAKLTVKSFDITGRVNFTLIAYNVAGQSNLTYWVTSGTVGGPPVFTGTLLIMLISAMVIG